MPKSLVVDCSIAAKWIFPEPGRAPALELLNQYEAGEILLIAPDLLLMEFASLVSKRNRRKEITAAQAREAFSLLAQCAVRLYETRALLARALAVSLQGQLSLWDSVYLSLALEQDCPMVTADLRLFRGGKERHPAIRLLVGPPNNL